MNYSVIIPIYNEDENISLLHEKLSQSLAEFSSLEIVFVDDRSSDSGFKTLFKNSGLIQRAKAAQHQSTDTLNLPQNCAALSNTLTSDNCWC